ELARLVADLDTGRAAVDEVQLVLPLVVVVEAFEAWRHDDHVRPECGDAERAPHLAETEAVPELVDRAERVAHGMTLVQQRRRDLCTELPAPARRLQFER